MNRKLTQTPEEIYNEFWKELVENEDGTINMEALKNELADYSHILDQVPTVYCHITGNTLSYPHYWAEDVIRLADDSYDSSFKQWNNDYLQEAKEAGILDEETHRALIEFLGYDNL